MSALKKAWTVPLPKPLVDSVRGAGFADTGEIVLLANWKNILWAWTAATGAVIDPLPPGMLLPLLPCNPTFSMNGAYMMLSKETDPVDHVALRDTTNGRNIQTYKGHTAQILAVACRPEADRVVTGSVDGTVRLWDLTRGTELAKLDHGQWVTHVCISKDAKQLCYVGKDSVLNGCVV